MAYVDTHSSREDRYSIGTEDESGQHYLSIPVSNGVFDYEEYYQITLEAYQSFLRDEGAARVFAESCRRHERDELLIERPGWNRGTPV